MLGILISQLVNNPWSVALGLLSLPLLCVVLQILEWAWFTPKRIERAFRAQGLSGTVYRSVSGDLMESVALDKEAWAKPMSFSHDITGRVWPFLHRAAREHGQTSFTWFGPLPRVTISDPQVVREMLSNKHSQIRKPNTNWILNLLIGGLFSDEGEKWVAHRRIMNATFHVEKLKMMLSAFSACCDELIDKWAKSSGPDGSFEVDFWTEMQIFSGDCISRAAFGSSYQEGRRIFQLIFEQGERVVQALQTFPGLWYLPTKNNRRMKQIEQEVKTHTRGIIEKRVKAIKNGEAIKDDLLGLMLESNMREKSESGKSNCGMSIDEIIIECKLFYLAGQESTSVLLTWTIILLSKHPEWQERAREEVLQQFGKNKPNFDGLSRLKIVTMILYETLRLYTPFPMINRRTSDPIKLGNITYPAGVNLLIPTLLIHHDKELWGEDADEFKPDRFSEGISKASKAKDGQTAFFPFGWGPRICIGQNFALVEAKLAVSVFLQHYKFSSEKYVHAPHVVITVHPQHGAPIKFERL